MKDRLDSFIERIQGVGSFDCLQDSITELRDIYDVGHVIYHSLNGKGQQYAALTYPVSWVDHYIDQDYSRVDPVVQGCWRRFHPVDWRRLDWSGKPARDFLAEARDAGVGNQGFTVPIRGPSGQFALFTISDSRTDAQWERFTEASVRELILAAHYINQKALELDRGTDEQPMQALSPREVDVCTLLAMGYSRAQAAESLSISEHTLRVYIEGARFKLGASNTVHAVARAMVLGLLVV